MQKYQELPKMSVYYIEKIFCQMATRYQNKIIIIFALSVNQYKQLIL